MPYERPFPGFWWFVPGEQAGMARPGFNSGDWRDLRVEESMLLAWIGKLAEPRAVVADLARHVDWYRTEVAEAAGLDAAEIASAAARVLDPATCHALAADLARRFGVFEGFQWEEDDLSFRFRRSPLQLELSALREVGVDTLICLTELPPDPVVGASGIDAHHFPIDDLHPPERAQVEAVAEILEGVSRRGGGAVVHCLAGIGRTTTVLAAAARLRGESLAELRRRVARANPRFALDGRQWAFVESL